MSKYVRHVRLGIGVWMTVLCCSIWLSLPSFAADRLVGWWRFDEGSGTDVYDGSRMGNHGKLHGGCSLSKDGVSGGAIDFTCLDGLVEVNHSPTLEPADGTIQLWLKVPLLHDGDVLLKTSNTLQNSGNGPSRTYGGVYGLRIRGNGGAYAYVLNDDPSGPSWPWTFAEAPAGSIKVATWHHLAMRWDSGKLSIFVDGVLKAQTAYLPVHGLGLSYGGTSALTFGQGTIWADQGIHEFLGKLDDVRFYNYGRSNSQISNDWHQRGANAP